MRIAVWHNLPSGGGKRALHDHVRGLAARGHHLESWSPPTANLDYMPLAPYATEHVVPLDPTPGIGEGRLGRWRGPYLGIEAMKRHSRRCVEEIQAGGFDLLMGNSCHSFAAPFVGRFATIPSVLYLQEPIRAHYEAGLSSSKNQMLWAARPPHAPSVLGWPNAARAAVADLILTQRFRVSAREEAINANAFDRLLCNSRYSREAMLKAYGRECDVCYLGIDVDAFPLNRAPKGRYAIGLGSFGPLKGVDLAIRSVGSIEPSRRPALVWVGNHVNSAEYFRGLVDLASGLGVEFVPKHMVSQAELVDLLGRAAVMVYPARLEPFGYAPLEANACGTTVVGIAEGGIRESIEPGVNGLLVDGPDPTLLGSAIAHYADDLETARLDGLRAHDHVARNWTIDRAIDRIEGLMISAVEARRVAAAV